MLKLSQINAESMETPLSESEQLVLTNIVKQYGPYAANIGKWPNLDGLIDEEQTTPTVKTLALRAVITSLEGLPEQVVESSGTDKEQSYFASKQNWDALAIDILSTMYEVPITRGALNFALVQRRISGLVLNESVVIKTSETGSRY